MNALDDPITDPFTIGTWNWSYQYQAYIECQGSRLKAKIHKAFKQELVPTNETLSSIF